MAWGIPAGFKCLEKKNEMIRIFLEELYLRRLEAFIKHNPDKDQQYGRINTPMPMASRVAPARKPCSRCPK